MSTSYSVCLDHGRLRNAGFVMQVYTAGIETNIKVWDLRKEAVVLTLEGHSDIVTGMSVSPDGSHLLTNSMDNTLRVWDVRPYAPENRCTKVRAYLNSVCATILVPDQSKCHECITRLRFRLVNWGSCQRWQVHDVAPLRFV